MRLYTPTDLAFAIGSQRVAGAMTELFILDRDLVEDRDPEGLIPINATRSIGLPPKLRVTSTGLAAYQGTAEEARKALTAVGMLEAPVAVPPDMDGALTYAQRFGADEGEDIRPHERLLHTWRDDRLFIIGRFPGEEDRLVGRDGLPEGMQAHFPAFVGEAGVALAHDRQIISDWLTAAKIPAAL